MVEATLSSKHQIVIPCEARKALGLKAGDKLLVTVLDDRVIVLRKPKSFAAALRGAGRGLYSPDYLQKERASWD